MSNSTTPFCLDLSSIQGIYSSYTAPSAIPSTPSPYFDLSSTQGVYPSYTASSAIPSTPSSYFDLSSTQSPSSSYRAPSENLSNPIPVPVAFSNQPPHLLHNRINGFIQERLEKKQQIEFDLRLVAGDLNRLREELRTKQAEAINHSEDILNFRDELRNREKKLARLQGQLKCLENPATVQRALRKLRAPSGSDPSLEILNTQSAIHLLVQGVENSKYAISETREKAAATDAKITRIIQEICLDRSIEKKLNEQLKTVMSP